MIGNEMGASGVAPIGVLVIVHNKPDLAVEALESVRAQTWKDWNAVIWDSGVLYDQGYYKRFSWLTEDRRFRLVRSDETEKIRAAKCMPAWVHNEYFRRGMAASDLTMCLCDDDVLYPTCFETFVGYSRQHPEVAAMYASQDIAVIRSDGTRQITGERLAVGVGGAYAKGRRMDCQVDYLQFCHKVDVLRKLPGDEYMPECLETSRHADGVFMERVGGVVPIYPINVKVSQNRRTPLSFYGPSN
jgi:hypothetical protein